MTAAEVFADAAGLPRAAADHFADRATAAIAANGRCSMALAEGSTPRATYDNGHTASLFPGRSAVHEAVRWVVACCVAEVGMWRLTLTPVAINAAARVTFLVAGTVQSAMLKRVLEDPYQHDVLPVQIVHPTGGSLGRMVDEAAAAELARVRSR